jgi:hypothetical protein
LLKIAARNTFTRSVHKIETSVAEVVNGLQATEGQLGVGKVDCGDVVTANEMQTLTAKSEEHNVPNSHEITCLQSRSGGFWERREVGVRANYELSRVEKCRRVTLGKFIDRPLEETRDIRHGQSMHGCERKVSVTACQSN